MNVPLLAFVGSMPRNEPGRKPVSSVPSPLRMSRSLDVNSPLPPALTASTAPEPVVRLAAVYFVVSAL